MDTTFAAGISGETKILTESGYSSIALAQEKGRLWTGSCWASYRRLQSGPGRLVDFQLANGQSMRAGALHRVLVLRGGSYVVSSCAELHVGDLVCLSMAAALESGRVLGDAEDFYWMGFGVGNACSSNANRNQICFTFGDRVGIYKKEERAGEFVRFMRALHEIEPQRPRVFENKISVSVANGRFRGSWEGLGYEWGRTAHTKRVPASVWRASRERREQFLLGLLEADGSIATPNAAIHLCQRELLAEVQLLLRGVGVESSLRGPYVNGERRSWRLDLVESQSRAALGFGRQRQMTKIPGMPVSAEVANAVMQLPTTNDSHKTIKSRTKKTGTIGAYTARAMFDAVGLPAPPIYAVHSVTAVAPGPRAAVTYSLVVDHSRPSFDMEGVIAIGMPSTLTT